LLTVVASAFKLTFQLPHYALQIARLVLELRDGYPHGAFGAAFQDPSVVFRAIFQDWRFLDRLYPLQEMRNAEPHSRQIFGVVCRLPEFVELLEGSLDAPADHCDLGPKMLALRFDGLA
jgi:hypothetical protein